MRIERYYADLTFNQKKDLVKRYNKLIIKAYEMDPIIAEIEKLKKGKVNPKSTKKRSKIGSYFSSEAQQIKSYIYRHRLNVDKDVMDGLEKVIDKGERILRENIVLQAKSPLDVIKFKNVPVRYAHNILGKKEQRFGYGLHKFPFTEQGYSVSIAFMPKGHTQMFHDHGVSEYSLFLDGKTVSFFSLGDGKAKDRKVVANKNEIIRFPKGLVHTLYNPLKSMTRNITVKSPEGVLDWKPFYNIDSSTVSRAKVDKKNFPKIMRGKLKKLSDDGRLKKITFDIRDSHYNYDLEIFEFKKNSSMENCFEKDRYFFVIEGKLSLSSKDVRKYCKKNDYIVVDKNTNFKMKAKTESRVYSVDI